MELMICASHTSSSTLCIFKCYTLSYNVKSGNGVFSICAVYCKFYRAYYKNYFIIYCWDNNTSATCLVSLTVLLCICVMPGPASWDPTNTKSVPLYAYNCWVSCIPPKITSWINLRAVALISAPPVVRHLPPS